LRNLLAELTPLDDLQAYFDFHVLVLEPAGYLVHQLLPLKWLICSLLLLLVLLLFLVIGLILPQSAMESRNPARLNESGARLAFHIGQVSGGEEGFKIVVVCWVSLAVEFVQPSDLVQMQMLLKLEGLL
jgi:uncharacterized membrane protein